MPSKDKLAEFQEDAAESKHPAELRLDLKSVVVLNARIKENGADAPFDRIQFEADFVEMASQDEFDGFREQIDGMDEKTLRDNIADPEKLTELYEQGRQKIAEKTDGRGIENPLRDIPAGKTSSQYKLIVSQELAPTFAEDREELEQTAISCVALAGQVLHNKNVFTAKDLADGVNDLRRDKEMHSKLLQMDDDQLVGVIRDPYNTYYDMISERKKEALGTSENVNEIVKNGIRDAARQPDPMKAMAPFVALSIAAESFRPENSPNLRGEKFDDQLLANAALIQNSVPFQRFMDRFQTKAFLDTAAEPGTGAILKLNYDEVENEYKENPDDEQFKKYENEKPYEHDPGIDLFGPLRERKKKEEEEKAEEEAQEEAEAGAEMDDGEVKLDDLIERGKKDGLFRAGGLAGGWIALLTTIMAVAWDSTMALLNPAYRKNLIAAEITTDSLITRRGADAEIDKDAWEKEYESVKASDTFKEAVEGKTDEELREMSHHPSKVSAAYKKEKGIEPEIRNAPEKGAAEEQQDGPGYAFSPELPDDHLAARQAEGNDQVHIQAPKMDDPNIVTYGSSITALDQFMKEGSPDAKMMQTLLAQKLAYETLLEKNGDVAMDNEAYRKEFDAIRKDPDYLEATRRMQPDQLAATIHDTSALREKMRRNQPQPQPEPQKAPERPGEVREPGDSIGDKLREIRENAANSLRDNNMQALQTSLADAVTLQRLANSTEGGLNAKFDQKLADLEKQNVVQHDAFQQSIKNDSADMLFTMIEEPAPLIEEMRKVEKRDAQLREEKKQDEPQRQQEAGKPGNLEDIAGRHMKEAHASLEDARKKAEHPAEPGSAAEMKPELARVVAIGMVKQGFEENKGGMGELTEENFSRFVDGYSLRLQNPKTQSGKALNWMLKGKSADAMIEEANAHEEGMEPDGGKVVNSYGIAKQKSQSQIEAGRKAAEKARERALHRQDPQKANNHLGA